MEDILDIDPQFPMATYTSKELIQEYHEYIMEYANGTRHTTTTKGDDANIFTPYFDVECILEENQETDDDEIQYKIRWKGWPKEYDSWTNDTLCPSLIAKFRRSKNTKNLGTKGFAAGYWRQLYSADWAEYMDGMENGQEHSDYVYYFFKKYGFHQQIEHIADFGFGHGNMLDAFVKRFRPKVAYGLEPSAHAFDQYTSSFMNNVKSNAGYFNKCHVHFECIDLMEYFKRENMNKKEVEIFNQTYEQKKKNHKMDVDGEGEDLDVQFCYCSRTKNNKEFFRRKEEKASSKLKTKSKQKKHKQMLLNAYSEYNCSCYSRFKGVYELGLCVSVFQYLNDDDVDVALCQLSKQCDFLYFDVVTSEEYDLMSKGSTFQDKWAISRPRKWYLERIFKYWRVISNEILESKFFYPDSKSSNVPNNIYVFNGL
eukprot:246711_1